jgi:glutamate 5-kinase
MFKRIIIKVGTKVLTNKDGNLDHDIIGHIVEQIIAVRNKGCEVVLVTSGAVGSGRAILKLGNKEETIADKQVYAAVGQVALMNTYAKYLKKYSVQSAQILVTKEDFRDRVHYQNMETCFLNVLRDNVLPIVNENDVVAVKELIFTDNDELTSLVALQLNADAVFILTSVDGVIAGDLNDPNAQVISEIKIEDLRVAEKFVTVDKSSGGRGGMLTKFAMARKMISAGITVFMLNGKKENGIVDLLEGKKLGTKFSPHKKVSSRKRRIAHGDSLARGSIVVNKCFGDQIFEDKKVMSLLPVGIISATGEFKKGDIVKIATEKGKVIGCGISKSDIESINKMAGTKGGRAIIHYDDMFIY